MFAHENRSRSLRARLCHPTRKPPTKHLSRSQVDLVQAGRRCCYRLSCWADCWLVATSKPRSSARRSGRAQRHAEATSWTAGRSNSGVVRTSIACAGGSLRTPVAGTRSARVPTAIALAAEMDCSGRRTAITRPQRSGTSSMSLGTSTRSAMAPAASAWMSLMDRVTMGSG